MESSATAIVTCLQKNVLIQRSMVVRPHIRANTMIQFIYKTPVLIEFCFQIFTEALSTKNATQFSSMT